MKVLFVIDPLPTLQAEVDSTVGLMLATQELGVEVWACGPEQLAVVGGRLTATATQIAPPARVSRAGDHRWVVEPQWWDELDAATLDVADDVAVVQLRIDPPVDARYLHTTYLLDLAEAAGVRVVNRPEGVRAAAREARRAAPPRARPGDRGQCRPAGAAGLRRAGPAPRW